MTIAEGCWSWLLCIADDDGGHGDDRYKTKNIAARAWALEFHSPGGVKFFIYNDMLKGSENLYEHTTATRTTRGSKGPKVQEARIVS